MNACVSSAACGDALARRRLARAKLQGGYHASLHELPSMTDLMRPRIAE